MTNRSQSDPNLDPKWVPNGVSPGAPNGPESPSRGLRPGVQNGPKIGPGFGRPKSPILGSIFQIWTRSRSGPDPEPQDLETPKSGLGHFPCLWRWNPKPVSGGKWGSDPPDLTILSQLGIRGPKGLITHLGASGQTGRRRRYWPLERDRVWTPLGPTWPGPSRGVQNRGPKGVESRPPNGPFPVVVHYGVKWGFYPHSNEFGVK